MLKNYVKSEMLKFIYNKWLLLSSFTLLLFIPSMTLVLKGMTQNIDVLYYQSKLLQSFYLGQAWFIIIAAFYFGNDYVRSSLRTNLLLIPNRNIAMLVKLMVLLFFTILLIIVSTILSLMVVYLSPSCPLSMAMIGKLLSKLWPVYLTIIQMSIISAGLTVLCKSSIATLSILLPLLLGLGQMLLQFSSFFSYAPILSTMNYYLLGSSDIYLEPTRGVLFQGLWMLVSLGIALVLFRKRCVK